MTLFATARDLGDLHLMVRNPHLAQHAQADQSVKDSRTRTLPMSMQHILDKRILRPFLLRGVAYGIAIALLLALLTPSVDSATSPHPSDEALIANWKKQRTGFEELLTMFRSDDRLSGIGPTFIWPEDRRQAGITLIRMRDYRKRCKALGVTAGITCYDAKQSIWFLASSRGTSTTSNTKGYAYLTEPPENVVPSLDHYSTDDGRSFTAFRHLEANWYLFLQDDY